jgi:aspartate aminotransferase
VELTGAPAALLTTSGTSALEMAVRLLGVGHGDEVIVPSFTFSSGASSIVAAGATPVFVDIEGDNGNINPALVEAAITPKTKVFMFSSPCNPSGAVYSKAELEALANLFKKYPHITILSDEIYEYINFIGKHESIAQFSEIKDQVIVINGLSKGFAMTGWRLGYTASNITLAKAMEKLQGQFTSGTCSITQKAAVAALVGDLKPSIAMTEEFTRRRTTTLALVNAMPGFKCFAPEGAFYVFPDVSSYYGKSDGQQTITNASDLSMFLLNTAHVSSVMGDAFGEPHCVRFSFANSMENIEKAWARIREALATLK